jgi:NADP-dependent 3-hydroxy acid dehydrogenase YdfG
LPDQHSTKPVAVITGASSGIRAVTARALAAHGYQLALLARRIDRLKDLAAQLDGTTVTIAADVTDRDALVAAADQVEQQLGGADVLVNNAGVMLLGPIVDAPAEEWTRMIDLNLSALMRVSHAALPHLLEAAAQGPRNVADLVNVSSVAGRRVAVGGGVYQATKHAVGAFSEAVRQEVAARHVRVSLVEPGAVATEIIDHVREEFRDHARQRFAGVERLEAADIADAIAYIVTRRRRVAINELLVRPTEQVA